MTEFAAAVLCGLEVCEYRDCEEGRRRFTSRQLLDMCLALNVSMFDLFSGIQSRR